MTQQAFAARFGFSVNTLRHWEQSKRDPEGPTRTYLLVIERAPCTVEKALRIACFLETDYVRGRMMKTRVTAWPNGVVEIQTTNRHHMASRWIGTITGEAAPAPGVCRHPFAAVTGRPTA